MDNTVSPENVLQKNAPLPGEAYYIFQGTPQKANDTERLSASKLSTNPLLQFDLKFDSLKVFLDNVATVVNQHATILNKLQLDLGQKIYRENLGETFRLISQKAKMPDSELYRMFHNMIEKPLLETSGDLYDDSVNGLCNRVESMNHGLIHFNKKTKELFEEVKKVKQSLDKKTDITTFKEKVKKTKKKLKGIIEMTQANLDEKIINLEKRLMGKIGELGTKVSENEKNTIWRIKDCEELLKSRVSDRYVNDAIEKLNETLSLEIKRLVDGNNDKFDTTAKEIASRMNVFENDIEDKMNNLKKSIREIQDNFAKKLDGQMFEEFRNVASGKIEKLDERLKDLVKKYDPMLDKTNFDINKVDARVTKFEAKLSEIEVTVENYILQGYSPDRDVNAEAEKKKNASAQHKEEEGSKSKVNIEDLEVYFQKYREDIAKIFQQLTNMQEDLSRKVDIGMFNLALNKKLDKDDFIKQINSMAADEERLRRAIEACDDVQKRLDRMNENTEKKLAKLRKDIDITAILKSLKGKAEEEQVLKGFSNVDSKIAAISDALALLKSEIDSAQVSIKSVSTQIVKFSDNAILTTKSVVPGQCLSCGNYAGPSMPVGQLKGNDGKFYKADLRTTSEMYEVTRKEHSHSLSRSFILEERELYAGSSPVRGKSIDKFFRPGTASAKSNRGQMNMLTTLPASTQQSPGQRVLRPMSAKK